MAYWLMKSEPGEWSWDDQVRDGVAEWDGVHNAQALKNMRAMKRGDLALFYHSGKQRSIVGVMEIAKEFYPAPDDEKGKSVWVDVRALYTLPNPISLKTVKARPELAQCRLVRQSRLSVMDIKPEEWAIFEELAGGFDL